MSVTRSSFDGNAWPPELVEQVLATIVTGSPFAASLAKQTTARASVAFMTAGPTGAGWVGEAQPLPEIALNDDSVVVAVKKLAGVLDVSNEALDDTALSLFEELRRILVATFSRSLDLGLLEGAGGNAPSGVIAAAPDVPAASLSAGVAEAVSQIEESGGTVTTLALSPTSAMDEATREDAQGRPIHADGLPSLHGAQIVKVPGLTTPLVYDNSRVILLTRSEFTVESSPHSAFSRDVSQVRIKGRFAAAIPDPEAAIRKVTVAP